MSEENDMAEHRAIVASRYSLTIAVAVLVIVLAVGTFLVLAMFAQVEQGRQDAERSEAQLRVEFEFQRAVSQAQTCALVAVIAMPMEDRTNAQPVIDQCYAGVGLPEDAPTVPDGG